MGNKRDTSNKPSPPRGDVIATAEHFTSFLYTQSIDPILVGDAGTGTILDCNPAAEAFFGYPRDQLIGMHQAQLHPPEEWDGDFTRSFTAHLENPSQLLEASLVHASGEIRVASVKANTFEVDGRRLVFGCFRDITEQKKTARNLQLSEQRFRQLFREMTVGFALHEIICDAKGTPTDYRFLEVNPAFERLVGTRAEDLLNRTVLEVLPETEPVWIERYGKVALTGETLEFEEYSKGLNRWYSVKAYSPEHMQFAVMFEDITQRKKAEEEFARIFRMSTDMICIADINNSSFLAVNPAFEHTLGYSPDEIIGKPFAEFLHPDDIEATDRVVKEQLRKGMHLLQFQNRHRCKDGSYRILSWNSHPLPEEGKTYAFARDITARAEAEQKLRENQDFIKAIMDNLPLGLAVNSVDPSVDFEYMNDNFPRLYRTTRKDIAEQGFWDAVYEDPDFREVMKHRILDDCASGDPERMQWTDIAITRGAEDVRFISARNTPVPEKNLMISVVWDVTDRVLLEGLMVQSEKMNSLGELAAGMAHEINNPLSAIIQSVQNARRRLSPDVEVNMAAAERNGVDLEQMNAYIRDRGIDRYMSTIQEAGLRAAEIIRNMLKFSRKSESTRTISPVEELLERALALAANDYDIKNQYDIKKIEFHRDYATGLPPVYVTETEILQVFLNVIKNAAQAMAKKTFPDHIRPSITLRTRLQDGMVLIEIEDNGPGMSEKDRRRVFDPFFTTKPVGEGTGLGLSVSYFIVVKNHGGLFNVLSIPGHKTVFSIGLPSSTN